jgi:hypothetical protein
MADGSVAYGSLPFKEQIAFFRNKKNVLTEAWTDVWQAEHDHAFMVAGANRIDLLVDLRSAVDKAIADGTGLEAFRHDFDTIVAKHGWAYNGGRNWRTRVIYETNLRTSYAAGRWSQVQALKKVRPYLRYRHSDVVQHPRPQHLAWNGLVLLVDDPWVLTHWCPNGWGCQCTWESLNDRDLKRLGKAGPDTAPAEDMQEVVVGKNGPSPRTVQTPAGVDPGFGYAPGKSAFEKLAQDVLTKAVQLPAVAGAQALEPILSLPRAQLALDTAYQAFREAQLIAGTASTSSVAVGALDPELVRALSAAGITPLSATIMVAPGAASGELAGNLPAVLRTARAVLLDRGTGVVLYVDVAAATPAGLRVVWVQPGGGAESYAGAMRASQASLQARLDAGELQLLRGSL